MINGVVRLVLLIAFVFTNHSVYAQSIKIPLSGTGDVPSSTDLAINPSLLENGEVELGLQRAHEIEISHTGGADASAIEILSIEIGGQDSYDFTSDYVGYNILETSQNLRFNVTFNPTTLGYKKAFLRIEHSGESSPHLVLLTGVGIDVPASALTITDTDLNFGEALSGDNATKTITLKNVGGDTYPTVNVYNVGVTGDNADAYFTNFGNSLNLAPGQSGTITITMNSSIAGQKSATLAIDHDGSNPTLRVALSGTVTLPPEIQPDPVTNNDNTTNTPQVPAYNGVPEFNQSKLTGANPKNPTSLQFGPDGNLYVAERDGFIYQYVVDRTNKNTYQVTQTDKIGVVQQMQNHNDNGAINNSVKGRLVTGILVAGSANNPVIYLSSADPRQGAGPSGNDSNLDTNSVIISRLTKNGNNWVKKDLVRGLPRSEENHQGNGLQLSADGNTLYISMGGHTNMGLPSNNFARIPEYALSAAILEINLAQIGNNTYDLPTLDDEDRPGVNDDNDPFGGNNGKNMAILDSNSPVKMYSPGWRNAYDIVITESGRMYTVDNGPNNGWGDKPGGNCLDNYADGGNTYGDNLHFVKNKGYYGGHPNPTRGSKNNQFNDSNPQSPIAGAANAIECQYKIPGQQDGALHVFPASTNGLTEYTASNFGAQMKGDLLTASFNKSVYRVQLNNAGTKIIGLDKFFTNLGTPLDVTAVGDNGKFPGTVWVADYAQNGIHVYEPKDY